MAEISTVVSKRNGRGNGALRKLGAVQEGLLRQSFARNGEYVDQARNAGFTGREEGIAAQAVATLVPLERT